MATQNQNEEVRHLRARGAQLDERLTAARDGLVSARERREFMEEEAGQAREYGKKLAQEMSRLARVAGSLPPDESASLEKLRRLVATLTEAEQQEHTVLAEGKAKEAALRAEIEDFTGGAVGDETTSSPVSHTATEGAMENGTVDAEAVVKRSSRGSRGGGRGGGGGDGAVQEISVAEDPLAMAHSGAKEENAEKSHRDGDDSWTPRMGLTAAGLSSSKNNGSDAGAAQKMKEKNTRSKAVEGRALLAEGLQRIEEAHEAAAAEREAVASRLSRLRLAVARRQRDEDATPGHAELLQYLFRFEELGQHAMEREKQLRQCRAERSTLALTREFLANEARLLESIADGVDDAASAKAGKGAREAYLRQLEDIVQGVEDSLTNQTRLLDVTQSRRRAAEEAQASFVEDRRRFLAGTKELADQCYRYEALRAHLTLMRR